LVRHKIEEMKLLVSVRNLQEARIAIDSGADRIDLKEPQNGPLGRCSDKVWQEVAENLNGQIEISLALGELSQWNQRPEIPKGIAAVKTGLACASPRWRERLSRFYGNLSKNHEKVAVYYADWQVACSPKWNEVLSFAEDTNCSILLVDTYSKRSGGVFVHHDAKQLQQMRFQASERGKQFTLAGSLQFSDLKQIETVCPSIVAVRGSVCELGRSTSIVGSKVQRWKRAIEQLSHTTTIRQDGCVPLVEKA